MSCNYAEGLSAYENKGILGTPEKFDSEDTLNEKCSILYNMIVNAKHVVVHTGAGISTSAGIPDFRGPNGVWTLETKGLKPTINTPFSDAKPTYTHMALHKLVQMGIVKYIVSQNIDGLHLKSGIERKYLAELHGNMFLERCNACQRQFVRGAAVETVGQKSLGVRCKATRGSGASTCRGTLYDLVLDWEHNLPEDDLTLADLHSSVADLSICFGTTLQIVPSGNLPTYTLKNGGKLAIINLQPTKYDKKAHLIVNYYADEVMKRLMKKFNFEISEYDHSGDPTKGTVGQEWAIPRHVITQLKCKYKETLKERKLMHVSRAKKRKINSNNGHVVKKENTDNENERDNLGSEISAKIITIEVDCHESKKEEVDDSEGPSQTIDSSEVEADVDTPLDVDSLVGCEKNPPQTESSKNCIGQTGLQIKQTLLKMN